MSEAEDVSARLWRKQQKLEACLTDDGGKPKWMRGRTFDRIMEKIDAVEEARDTEFFLSAAQMFRRRGVNVLDLLGRAS